MVTSIEGQASKKMPDGAGKSLATLETMFY
jgi:hypothetical protein